MQRCRQLCPCLFPPVPQPKEKPSRQDAYLDGRNPVENINENKKIGILLEQINVVIAKQPSKNKWVTVSREEEAEMKRAVQQCMKDNPKPCTSLMKELLNLIPHQKEPKKESAGSGRVMKKNSKLKEMDPETKKKLSMYLSKRPKVVYKAKITKPSPPPSEPVEGSIIQINLQNEVPGTMEVELSDQEDEEDIQGDREEHERRIDEINLTEEDMNIRIVKCFVYLYTSSYLYKDIQEAFTNQQYHNYLKVLGFVTRALRQLPKKRLEEFKLPQTTRFSLYRGLKNTDPNKVESGYWRSFASCSLRKVVAQSFMGDKGGCLIDIRFVPSLRHMYIKVPQSVAFSNYDEDEIILFPFFRYEVLERNPDKRYCVIKEFAEDRQTSGVSINRT